jgi:hypothetical protein
MCNARCWWLTPIILATQETEIRKIAVWSQPTNIVCETLSGKNPSQKRAEIQWRNESISISVLIELVFSISALPPPKLKMYKTMKLVYSSISANFENLSWCYLATKVMIQCNLSSDFTWAAKSFLYVPGLNLAFSICEMGLPWSLKTCQILFQVASESKDREVLSVLGRISKTYGSHTDKLISHLQPGWH